MTEVEQIAKPKADIAGTERPDVRRRPSLCFGLPLTTNHELEFTKQFDAAAADPDVGISELARLVAEALRDAANTLSTKNSRSPQ